MITNIGYKFYFFSLEVPAIPVMCIIDFMYDYIVFF